MSTSFLSPLLGQEPQDWQAVLEAVITEFGCSTGTLHSLDPADGLLKKKKKKGIPPQLMPVVEVIPVGKGIAGAAAERREPVELCNLQADLGGVAKEGARQTNVQGSIAVPILEGESLRGTLGIGKMVPYDFSESEKATLLLIAADMAPKI
ncbi:MAG TPA: GAF domain-containing protein [Verrucomicrobium sp.]|nr:GAF domain-containing protein [Verrucomicrobium sp.]